MKAVVVAEIGSNWEGNVSKAKKIIKECRDAGADAVKFQMWRAKDLYSVTHPEWNIIKKSEVTFEKAKKFKEIADQLHIEFFCSVFYPEAVEFLEDLKVKRYKIASRTCLFKDPYSLETLQAIAKTRKPVIISMGMGGNREKIKKIFERNEKTFCYCISEYPLEFQRINWKLALKFDGFSDHTMETTAPILYATFKKQQNTPKIIIEKHVKLIDSKGPDASTSIDTDKLKELVSHIRLIEKGRFT
ncbi:MAG: N-acetylneuraminate synthase family protein [Thermoproteota archaeon]